MGRNPRGREASGHEIEAEIKVGIMAGGEPLPGGGTTCAGGALQATLPAEGAAAGAAHGGAAALADNEDPALRARLSGVAHVGGKGGVFLRHSLQA